MVWIRFYVAALKPLPGKSVSRQAPAIMVPRLHGNVTRENGGLSRVAIDGLFRLSLGDVLYSGVEPVTIQF